MTASQTLPPVETPASPRSRRLHRSHDQRVLAGVCGGIAEYFGTEPVFVRLLALVLWVVTGIVPLFILYLVAAIVIPESGATADPPHAGEAARGQSSGTLALLFGVFLIVLGLAAFAREVLHVDWDLVWPFGLIAVGSLVVLMGFQRQSRD